MKLATYQQFQELSSSAPARRPRAAKAAPAAAVNVDTLKVA